MRTDLRKDEPTGGGRAGRGIASARRLVRIALVNALSTTPLLPSAQRLFLWRLAGLAVGKSTVLSRVIVLGAQVHIGDNCFINRRCLLDGGDQPGAGITLEDDVFLAFDVELVTSTHDMGPSRRRAGRVIRRPVRICRGSWLGARATVLPGVTVAEGCVIASGAVVTRDTAPDGLYAGVPAQRIRDLRAFTVSDADKQPAPLFRVADNERRTPPQPG